MGSMRASKFHSNLHPLNLDVVAKLYVQAKSRMYVKGNHRLLLVQITLSGDVLEVHYVQWTY